MFIFDDLKSPFEELKHYFSLYNIVLPDHRIQYYAEVIEDMVHNKEPVIRYMEDLIEIVKKKEPSFNKGTYKAWRKNN